MLFTVLSYFAFIFIFNFPNGVVSFLDIFGFTRSHMAQTYAAILPLKTRQATSSSNNEVSATSVFQFSRQADSFSPRYVNLIPY